MPSLTVQCGRYFSFASFCFSASCSGDSFDLSGSSTNPCQPVRSFPLKSSLNPSGGLLSAGPAFSSSAREHDANNTAVAKLRNTRYLMNHLHILDDDWSLFTDQR